MVPRSFSLAVKISKAENKIQMSTIQTVEEVLRVALSLALASALLLTANATLGLGLGRIDVQSASGEPLSAEIELLNSQQWLASEVSVALASSDEFANFGVERAIGLQDFRFEIVDRETSIVVKIRSEALVFGPALNFVLALESPRGRELKAYTAVLGSRAVHGISESTSITTNTDAKPPQSIEQRNLTSSRQGLHEYRTKIGDTLWSIALASRPDQSITIPQMVIAIQEENPEAFVDGNINRLRADYALKVPSSEVAVRIKSHVARNKFVAQNLAFSGHTDAKMEGFGEVGDLELFDEISDSSESDAISQPNERSGVEFRLTIDDEYSEASRSGGGRTSSLARELDEKTGALEIASKELKGMNDRLSNLETQLGSLTSVIKVKDRDLARLQQSLEGVRKQLESATSIWTNPLVVALFLVIVLLVVLVLVLLTRLRQQARLISDSSSSQQVDSVTSDMSHELDPDPKISESLDLSAKEEPGTIDVDGGPIDADLMNNPLDLARAYIEMGDFKAAEAQLVRVIATGNSGEVREAEQLMRQLPS